MRKRDWARYYKRYLPVMKAIARKLAKQDNELAEDLEQEAALALLRLDPKRATTNEDAFVRMALRNSMVDYLRKNMPKKYESLDHRLECGDQVEQLTSGELFLITSREPVPKLVADVDHERRLDEV